MFGAYIVKEKGSNYYLKWVAPNDNRCGAMTDNKEDAIRFTYAKAKKVAKELLGEFEVVKVSENGK